MSTIRALPDSLSLGLTARRLDAEDEGRVAAFCEQSSAFFTLVTGEAASDQTAHHLLESRPASVEPGNKHLIGFERSGVLVGIVDLLEGYPEQHAWYVGLLLLAPGDRRRGLGAALWNTIEEWIRANGGRHVRLIVQKQNPDAARFWGTVGFGTAGTVEQRLASQTNSCWQHEKQLGLR